MQSPLGIFHGVQYGHPFTGSNSSTRNTKWDGVQYKLARESMVKSSPVALVQPPPTPHLTTTQAPLHRHRGASLMALLLLLVNELFWLARCRVVILVFGLGG